MVAVGGKSNQIKNTKRGIFRWQPVKRAKATRAGKKLEYCLCCAGVAEEVGKGGRFLESERGLEGGAWDGVEGAVEEEVFLGLRLSAASTHQSLGFEVRLVGAKVASAGS